MINQLWMIYALIFGAVLLGVRGLFWLFYSSRSERKIINRRLALTNELSDAGEVLEALRRERGVGPLGGLAGLQWLEGLVVQTGMKLSMGRLAVAILALTVAFFLPFGVWLGLGIIGLVPAIGMGIAAVYLFLLRARSQRINKFSEQLPEALDIIVRGLRAGHPFRVTLGLVARELSDPIGTEFGIMLDEISFGLNQQAAVDHLYARVGQEDLAFFSIAINIQSETGGNLTEVLQGLARLLRNRSKMSLKIRALTSEGRLSAIFMSAMPFLLLLAISVINPSFFGDLKGNPILAPAIILGLAMLGIGNVMIYRMVNFKF